MAYATVRQCRAENGAQWIGAEFEPLAPDHQRRLSRHILQAQIKQRKQ
jgi:c-di-GMP-binding flagellar brake protein YcgR